MKGKNIDNCLIDTLFLVRINNNCGTQVIVPLENVNLEILISATFLEEGIGVSEI